MKLDNRMLSMALASAVKHHAGPLNESEKKARLYLAQHMWDHPSGLKQQLTAADLLQLGNIPAEEWPDPLPDERTALATYAKVCEEIRSEPVTTRLKHVVLLRRLAWAARIYAATIEKDLQDAVRSMENVGSGRLTIVDRSTVPPAAKRRYVMSAGRQRKSLTTEKSE